jgi:glycine cleavage system H protein
MYRFAKIINYNIPKRYLSSKIKTITDEWYLKENNYYKIGLTNTISEEILYIDIEEGTHFRKDETMATIETVKAAGEINTLFDCSLVEINDMIIDNLEILNNDIENENNWILKIEPYDQVENPDEILHKMKVPTT